MDIDYAITPLVAWLAAGSSKFLINSIKARQWAFGQIGYGGLPSNHSAIVSSAAAMVFFKEGIDHPAFGIAVALMFIVILDASSLRQQIGRHATAINRLNRHHETPALRERIGHTRLEIVAGIGVGILTAWMIARLPGLLI